MNSYYRFPVSASMSKAGFTRGDIVDEAMAMLLEKVKTISYCNQHCFKTGSIPFHVTYSLYTVDIMYKNICIYIEYFNKYKVKSPK